MTDTVSLPFALSVASLAEWVNSLSPLPAGNAANQLNQVLKQLNHQHTSGAELLPLLVNLTPLTLHLAHSLTAATRSEADLAANSKALKIARLAIQLLRHLSLAFCRLVETKQLDTAQTQQAIFHALQCIGFCQRTSAMFYEMPSATLWKKTGLLYGVAVDNQLLHHPLSVKTQEFKALSTIEAVIKRNLLFALSEPNRYTVSEIGCLFQLANQQQHRLDMGVQILQSASFYWIAGHEPLLIPRSNRSLPGGAIPISCQAIGQDLQRGEITTELSPHAQATLASRLTGYANIFAAVVIGPPLPAHLLEGFVAVGAQLQGEEKLSRIMSLGAQPLQSRSLARDLTLEPLEHEKGFSKPLNSSLISYDESGTSLRLLRTASKQYLVAETTAPHCATGDIALLCREQQPAKLVIVRHQTAHEDTTLILLELVAGSVTIRDIETSADTSSKAILIGRETDRPDVFLAAGKYLVGTKIKLAYDKTIYLKACLESNAWLTRFRIGFDS